MGQHSLNVSGRKKPSSIKSKSVLCILKEQCPTLSIGGLKEFSHLMFHWAVLAYCQLESFHRKILCLEFIMPHCI